MRGPTYRWFARAVAVAACLASTGALLTGSAAARRTSDESVRILQLNLCNSGLAGCFTGRALSQAAAVIRAQAPDVVTLNEICENDVDALGAIMDASGRQRAERSGARGQAAGKTGYRHGGRTIRAFKAAPDRPSASDTRCRNGQPFGVGLLVRAPAAEAPHTTYSGIYPAQDLADPEIRVWLCVHAPTRGYACTTHLASTSAAVARAQCEYLVRSAIPAVRRQGGPAPVVFGGDLNLPYRGGVRSCLPAGYHHRDDGSVQHIAATTDLTLRGSGLISMNGTSDHPSLLVSLVMDAAGRRPA